MRSDRTVRFTSSAAAKDTDPRKVLSGNTPTASRRGSAEALGISSTNGVDVLFDNLQDVLHSHVPRKPSEKPPRCSADQYRRVCRSPSARSGWRRNRTVSSLLLRP
jgi:hypothetical protein